MKRLLLVLLLGLVQVQAQVGVLDLADPVFLGGTVNDEGGSTPSYDLYETFEASEYDNTWAEAGTGTVDGDATHPAALTGGGSYCLQLTQPGASATRTTHDHGSTFTTFGARFYIYIDTLPVTNFDRASVFGLGAGSYFNLPVEVRIRNSSGSALLMLSGTTDQQWTVSVDSWILVELHGELNGGTVYMRVDGADEQSVTSNSYTPQYVTFGAGLYSKDSDCYFDNLGMNFGTDAYP